MKLYGLAESVAEDHDAAIDAIDICFDEFAGSIFRDVNTMSIEYILSLALEVLSTVVLFIDVSLHQGKADIEEESVSDLEGLVKELMQSDDIGEGNDRDIEEARVRQWL